MLLFNPVGFRFLSRHLLVHLVAVGVVVGQRAVDLCEGEMRVFRRDFFRGQAEFVIAHNGPNRHAGPGNMRCAALDAGRAGNQGADVNVGYCCVHSAKMAVF